MSDATWIYGLLCPETKKIRYVGASGNPVMRYKAHTGPTAVKDGRGHSEDTKQGWISALEARSKEPELVILEKLEGHRTVSGVRQPSAVTEAEYAWMRKLISEGHPLTNVRLPPDLYGPTDDELMDDAIERGRKMFGD